MVQRMMESQDRCLARPVLDDEIEDALRKLRSSTEAIEHHTRVLKAQQDSLAEFLEDNRRTDLCSRRATESRRRKRLQERNELDEAVIPPQQ